MILIGLVLCLFYVGLAIGKSDYKPYLGQSFAAGFFLAMLGTISAVTILDSHWVNDQLVDEINHNVIATGRPSFYGMDWGVILTSERFQTILWFGTVPISILAGAFLTILELIKTKTVTDEDPYLLWGIVIASGYTWLTSLEVTTVLSEQMNRLEIMGGLGPALPFPIVNHLYCDVPLAFFVIGSIRLAFRRMGQNKGFQSSDISALCFAGLLSIYSLSNTVMRWELSFIPLLIAIIYTFCIWFRDRSSNPELADSNDRSWESTLRRYSFRIVLVWLVNTVISLPLNLGEFQLQNDVTVENNLLLYMVEASRLLNPFEIAVPGTFNGDILMKEISYISLDMIVAPWKSMIQWLMMGLYVSWLGACCWKRIRVHLRGERFSLID